MVAIWGRDVEGRGAGFAKRGACDLAIRDGRRRNIAGPSWNAVEKGKPWNRVDGVGRTVPVPGCQLPSTLVGFRWIWMVQRDGTGDRGI